MRLAGIIDYTINDFLYSKGFLILSRVSNPKNQPFQNIFSDTAKVYRLNNQISRRTKLAPEPDEFRLGIADSVPPF